MAEDRALTHLARLNRAQAVHAAKEALLLVPLGATEQHGPHLPVSTDTLLLEVIAERVVARLTTELPIVLAPTLPFGSSDHHIPFGGTLSLSTQTYFQVLMELGRSAVQSGFRRLFFLNGHGGNHELAELAARDLALQHDCAVGAGSWWAMANAELVEAAAGRLAPVPGHAGGFETSGVLAAAPALVFSPPHRRQPASAWDELTAFRAEVHGWWADSDGYTDNPAAGDAELGEGFLTVASEKVATEVARFYRGAADRLRSSGHDEPTA